MFIERLLPIARKRLVTIADDASLVEAAKLLRAGTDLLVVCDSADLLIGVITKTDIVREISRCQGGGCTTAVSALMTRDPVLCRASDLLYDVWERMKARNLRNIPVTDRDCRPKGVCNARDILQVLLNESEYGEAILRDYVMGVGYLN
jgi:CBS domain-containing protein